MFKQDTKNYTNNCSMLAKSTKILFCMHMPPPVHGAAVMGQYIHDSPLINDTFECKYINIATASSVDDIGRGGIKKVVRFVSKLRTIKSTIKAFHPDIVYVTPAANAPAFYKDYIIVQLLKRWCRNVVLHYHNKGIAQISSKWYNNLLCKRFFNDVKVILLSDLLYPDVAAFVPHDKVLRCPNGIPDIDKSKSPIQHKNAQVLFLSNLIRSKGILTLLDALALLKQYDFHCVIAGAPGDISADQLQYEIQNRNIQHMVSYFGRANTEQKLSLFDQSDIFVHPTENDCFPLVLLEAMRSGVPCVTTLEGAISDIVVNEETGWLVEKQNASALAEKMEWLIMHPQEGKEMGALGRKRYEQQFTLEHFEVRMVEILRDCLTK